MCKQASARLCRVHIFWYIEVHTEGILCAMISTERMRFDVFLLWQSCFPCLWHNRKELRIYNWTFYTSKPLLQMTPCFSSWTRNVPRVTFTTSTWSLKSTSFFVSTMAEWRNTCYLWNQHDLYQLSHLGWHFSDDFLCYCSLCLQIFLNFYLNFYCRYYIMRDALKYAMKVEGHGRDRKNEKTECYWRDKAERMSGCRAGEKVVLWTKADIIVVAVSGTTMHGGPVWKHSVQ